MISDFPPDCKSNFAKTGRISKNLVDQTKIMGEINRFSRYDKICPCSYSAMLITLPRKIGRPVALSTIA